MRPPAGRRLRTLQILGSWRERALKATLWQTYFPFPRWTLSWPDGFAGQHGKRASVRPGTIELPDLIRRKKDLAVEKRSIFIGVREIMRGVG